MILDANKGFLRAGFDEESGDLRLYDSAGNSLTGKGGLALTETDPTTGQSVIVGSDTDLSLSPNQPLGKGKNYLIYPGVTALSMTGLTPASFTFGGATSVHSMDADNKWFQDSTQVLDVANTGAASAALNIARTLPSPIEALGEAPSLCIPLWIEDYLKLGGITIRLSMGDATFANQFFVTWGISPSGNPSLQRNGWQFAFFGPSDWQSAGTPTWNMPIHAVRFQQLNSPTLSGGRVKYDSIILNYRALANFIMMIDGAETSLDTFMRQLCNSLGIPISCSMGPGVLGQPGKISVETAREMAREGHVFVPRNSIRVGLPGAQTNAQVSANLRLAQDTIRDVFAGIVSDSTIERWVRHWTCANGVNAFTQGDRSLFDYLAEHNGIVTARTTDTTNGARQIPQGYGQDNLFQMPIIDGWVQSNDAFYAALDKTIERNAMAIAFTHGVTNAINPGVTTITYKQMESRLRYAKTKEAAGLLKFSTLPDWYDNR